MSFWLAVIVIVMVVTCGEVVTRAIEAFSARKPLPSPPESEELRRLRERLDALAEHVDRISEEQKFLTRLLEERPRLPDHGRSGEADEW